MVNAACLITIMLAGGTASFWIPSGWLTVTIYFDMTPKPPSDGTGGDRPYRSEDAPPASEPTRLPKAWVKHLGS